MPTFDRFLPITKAKSRLLDLTRDVERDDDVVAITRNGVSAAILLRPANFEGFLETLEILGDARTMRALRQAAAGKCLREAEAFGPE